MARKVVDKPLDISVETITLDVAEKYLALNVEDQRNVRARKVEDYKRDMLAGSWHAVGDPLRFDTEGGMIDGQHRMMAFVEAAKENPKLELQFIVVRGVQPAHRGVIDTGAKRSPGDQLKMLGYANPATLAAAARWCLLFDRHVLGSDAAAKSVTHAEVIDYVSDHDGLIEIVSAVTSRLKQQIDIPGGNIAAGYYLVSRVDDDAAFEFFERLADGEMLRGGNPILALRSRLRELDKHGTRLSGEVWMSLILRTWNAWREDRPLRNIPVERAGKPIPAPDELL